MGKPTGFLEYDRVEERRRPPLERARDWNEFHLPLPEEERREQGARCMDCGVPFCQAGLLMGGKAFGCPLHNLIPEWNDMIMMGNKPHALARLLKTNNFPEFTGRVCPAPCEKACNCGKYEGAVTIREGELGIIEAAWAEGRMTPRQPPRYSGKKVCVVGSGPAGLAAADQLNRRGHSVTVVEREAQPGGLLMYGIPNMKLPKDIVRRRLELMTDEGVTFVTGVDAAVPDTAQRLLREYDAVILCCGSRKPRELGFDTAGVSGIYYGVDYLKASVERYQFGLQPDIPSAEGKNVVVIGTGDTAADCVGSAIRQGCASVTQLVRRSREDYPAVMPADYAHEEAEAVFGADPRRYGAKVASVKAEGGALKAVVTGSGEELPCELLVGATGFAGCEDAVCAAFGVEQDKTVVTKPGHYRTSVEKVFSAGDMRRGQSLVVWAIAEGRSAAREADEFMLGYTNLV